jgi:hypothetical protein
MMHVSTNRKKRFLIGNKKATVIIILFAGVITAGSVAIGRSKNDDHFVNLKILPKSIGSKQLSQIMVDDFSDGLGVSCSFCHVEEMNSLGLYYASDGNPQKIAARSMMKMTLRINKQFFNVKRPLIGDSILVVNCVSCHHGTAFPYPPE